MHTQPDAVAHITEAIEATGVVQDAAAEYDLDAIADELYTAAGGWNIDDLDTGIFWAAVQRHTLDNDQDAPAAPAGMSADTDMILNGLAYAAERVAAAREDVRAAESARDELLIRAARTGTLNQSRLAQLAGVTRGRAHQIIHR